MMVCFEYSKIDTGLNLGLSKIMRCFDLKIFYIDPGLSIILR